MKTDSKESLADKKHELERVNKKLIDSISRLELGLGTRDGGGSSASDSEERSLLALVKGLKQEIDAALALKQTLEAELAVTREKPVSKIRAPAESQTPMTEVEPGGTIVDELHQKISFLEEERGRISHTLAQTKAQVKELTEELSWYVQKGAVGETHNM